MQERPTPLTLLLAAAMLAATLTPAIAGDDCPPQELTVVLDTGWDEESGTLISAPNDDDDWIVTLDASGGTTPRPADTRNPVGAWQTIPNTMWLAATQPGGPSGFYAYETCWCMRDGFSNVDFTFFIRADDAAEVFVNSTSIITLPDGTFNDASPVGASVAPSVLVPGQNCMTVVVEQKYGGPHGFNLQSTLTADNGRCCECTPPPADLEAWWPLDELVNPTAFDIIGGHDGFHSGTSTPPLPQPDPSGYVNGSLLFDGADDYVRVPNDAGLNFGATDELTIDAWIRTTAPDRHAIVNKKDIFPTDRGYHFQMGGGLLGFEIGDGASFAICNGVTPINDGAWHFVAVTLARDNPSGIVLYVDGVPDATCSSVGVGNLTNTRNLHHGGDPLHPNGIWWDGNIDEIELFRRALTPAEIADLYAAGNQGKCPPQFCEDASGLPVCEGLCPTGEVCVDGPAGGPPCDCVPETVPCDESEWPVCDGDCPPGQSCLEGPANDCFCQDLIPDDCESSPYPECNGICDNGESCEPNPVQGCDCIPPTPCDLSFYPTCSGVCDTGEVCVPGPNQDCFCEPETQCGDPGDYPTCGGNCPAGQICEQDIFTQMCDCVDEFPACGDTFYPECDGDCPAGETCENVFGTDECACQPEPQVCGDPLFPECNGSCPANQKCRERLDGNPGCECVACDVVGTGGLGGVLVGWASDTTKSQLRWTSGGACATFYNAYRETALRLADGNDDGLADDYGDCYLPDIISLDLNDPSKPPPGETHWYLVTPANFDFEGSLGENSQHVERPNVNPCP